MASRSFFPYLFAREELELRVTSLWLDGVARDPQGVVSDETCSVALNAETDPWEEARMLIEVRDPNDQVREMLLAGEDPTGDADLLAVLRASASRERRGIPLKWQGDSWKADLVLVRSRCRGVATLEVVAARARAGEPREGRAWRRGERIASAAPWRV